MVIKANINTLKDKRILLPREEISWKINDKILENLVQTRTHVNIAVSEGRAVMQYECRRTLGFTAAGNSLVKLL